MDKDTQRIEIAKIHKGWIDFDKLVWCDGVGDIPWNGRKLFGSSPKDSKWHEVLDYLNDLNAMHEAEKILTPEQSKRYAEFILDILEIPTPFIGTARCAFLTGHATAEQRAEAFLKTLNLWKD